MIDNKHQQFENAAKKVGLVFLGGSNLDVSDQMNHFKIWLKENKNAEMGFMENHIEVRTNPQILLPGAQSALCFGFNYNHDCQQDSRAKSAKYACYKDYHKMIKKKLNAFVEQNFSDESKNHFRICIDTLPVLERAITANSSGFIGKNTCYIHPEHGSFMLLGLILCKTNFSQSSYDKPNPNQRTKLGGCGTCKRCQIHCPTGALDQEYKLDARKCISYWTIEHRGEIPLDFWPHLKHNYFGCDICQNVCPYNRQKETSNLEVHRDSKLSLEEIALMNQTQYEQWFGGTPMTRAKISGLKRNALIALAQHDPKKSREIAAVLSKSVDEVVKNTAIKVLEII